MAPLVIVPMSGDYYTRGWPALHETINSHRVSVTLTASKPQTMVFLYIFAKQNRQITILNY